MPSLLHAAIGTALLSLAAIPGGARAAQSYDSCTGFIDSVPATIGTQGVWCLRGDLATAMASGSAITVSANNVTIDCNGFKLGGLAAGESSQAVGINLESMHGATVRGCNIRGFYAGIFSSGGSVAGAHVIEDNRLDSNLQAGIRLGGSGSVVRRNVVTDTGGATGVVDRTYAITVCADVFDNVIDGVFSTNSASSVYGINLCANHGVVARGNIIRGLALPDGGHAIGIQTGGYPGDRIEDNHIMSTNAFDGWGINANTGVFCRGNTITNFNTAIRLCTDAGGNASN